MASQAIYLSLCFITWCTNSIKVTEIILNVLNIISALQGHIINIFYVIKSSNDLNRKSGVVNFLVVKCFN